MKNSIYILTTLFCGTLFAQNAPTEVKEETEVKTVAFEKNDKMHKGKIKVVTKETSNVKLDANDVDKVNQDRISATKKVQKTVMIDNDKDAAYDILTKETFYVNDNKDFRFSPSESGFDIAFSEERDDFINVGEAWNTQNKGIYIITAKTYSGIGYFDKNGNFVVEYYDDASGKIHTTTYAEKNIDS